MVLGLWPNIEEAKCKLPERVFLLSSAYPVSHSQLRVVLSWVGTGREDRSTEVKDTPRDQID